MVISIITIIVINVIWNGEKKETKDDVSDDSKKLASVSENTVENTSNVEENDMEKDLENIFSPYKKGINGQFGLGLSIVRETLAFCGYEVTVKNEKKGVSFMIQ